MNGFLVCYLFQDLSFELTSYPYSFWLFKVHNIFLMNKIRRTELKLRWLKLCSRDATLTVERR